MRGLVLVASVTGIAFLVVLPLVSFAVCGLGGGGAGVTVGQAAGLPDAARTAARLGTTLLIGAAAGSGALILGLPVALLLERAGAWRGRGLARVLALVPLVIPPYLHAVAWIGLFAGPAASPAGPLAPAAAGAAWLFSTQGTILVLIAALWPCVAASASAGLRSLDPRLEESARLAGGAGFALRRVTLPLAARHAAAGALFASLLAMAEIGVPALFDTPTLAAEIYVAFAAFYDAEAALRLCVILLAPLAAAAAAVAVLVRAPRVEKRVAGGAPALLAGPRLLLALAPAALAFAAGLLLPLASFAAGLGAAPAGALARAWETASGDLGTTLGLALAGAAAATALALAARLAFGFDRGLAAARRSIGLAAFAALALPGAVVGIGLIHACNRPGLPGALYGSAAIVVLAYAARCFWIPWAGLGAGLRGQGERAIEAARVAGIPWWRAALGIQIPSLRAEIAACFTLAFLFCFGELGSVLLVHPPGVDVLPWRIFDLVHYAYDDTVAALGLMAVGTCVAVVAAGGGAAGLLYRGRQNESR